MIETLRILATITDYTNEQLADLVHKFGRDCSLHQLTVPVTAVIDARAEFAKAEGCGMALDKGANKAASPCEK